MSANPPIRLAKPLTDDDELREIAAVLASGYLTQGPKVAEFERLVATHVGSRHAYAMSSCTTALHLSLAVLDIGPGDEVLVPDFTFPATANVVVQIGARPVLVDIDLDTFAMDPADAARKVTTRTRAMMPVHPFGCSADMDALLALARERGLRVIEDAACAIGASYRGRMCGAMGDLGCFSFHPRKVITTGEGGMITTDDEVLAERIQLLRNHGGIRREGRYYFEAAGYNYRLSDLLAAVGVAQMRKLDRLIAAKRALAAQMRELLRSVPAVTAPQEPAWGGHIYQSYVVLLPEGVDRDRVIALMKADGVETTLGTYALHAEPFFARTYGYRPEDLPNAMAAGQRSLTLPLYPPLEHADLQRVVASLAAALARD